MISCFIFSVDAVIPDYLIRAKPVHKPKRNFKPTLAKCCKIGERTARKLLTCSVGAQVTFRKSNYVHRDKINFKTGKRGIGKQLAGKIEKCAGSKYAKMFEKCCTYRAEFYKELRICKWKHRKKAERRKCKRQVRKSYNNS